MVYNKIYAQIWEERHITLDPINYQYDVKQILVISGETVPEYYEADICNVGDTATLTMVGTAADGVEIPDKFLLDGRNVLVYVVIPGSGGDVQTRYDITIPVDERAEREDIDPSEEEQQQIDSLIAALNSGVGRAEAAVTHYPKIVDGYWYVWNAETETWVNTEIRAEGRDGYSPEVTITEIEGGHRVTITDEDHPQGQTFDVMDGQGGSTGDYDELTNRPRINGHTLTGNQSASDLGLGTYSKPASGIPKTDLAQGVQQSLNKADTALQTAPVQSVAGKTGAVTLGAGDVGFSSSEEYNEGTVGAELSELNRQLSDLEDTVSTTQIINSASGAIASFDDGADGQPIRKLVAQIEPVQDLHGYDHPWPAGGGKNLLFVDSKATGTLSGMTITSDDDFIYVNGTKYGSSQNLIASMPITLPSGTYYVRSFLLSGTYSTGSSFGISLSIDSTTHLATDTITSEKAFTLESETTFYVNVISSDRNVISNVKVGVVISKTSGITQFSPYSNICPISGHTGAEIEQRGKNLFDKNAITLGFWLSTTTGLPEPASEYAISDYIPVFKNVPVFIPKAGSSRRWFYDRNKTPKTYLANSENQVYTPAENGFLRITLNNSGTTAIDFNTYQVEIGNATTYAPYTGNQISVTFPTTIYGGEDDVISGKLKSTMGMVDLGTLSWSYSSGRMIARISDIKLPASNFTKANAICSMYPITTSANTEDPNYDKYLGVSRYGDVCVRDSSYTDAASFKTAMSGVKLCYELAEPVEYTLTANELSTLYGQNNVWTDVGDVSVDYPADTKLYIDNKIATAVANALNA